MSHNGLSLGRKRDLLLASLSGVTHKNAVTYISYVILPNGSYASCTTYVTYMNVDILTQSTFFS